MPRRRRAARAAQYVGNQPPRYRFFMNPYADNRFTSCPLCGDTTHVRKLPLVIHVIQAATFVLNKTCRFCPDCDLLIAHQDEIESELTVYFGQHAPEVVGSAYMVIGTEDQDDWERGMRMPPSPQDTLDRLHDFREQVTFGPPPRS